MKNVRKYLIFPITYLILELVEEFVYYKCELIPDPWIRTAVVLITLIIGISLLAFVLVPFFEGGLDTVRKSHKHHGPLADFVVTILIIAALYFIYYIRIRDGSIESIMPPFLLN